MSSAYQNSPGAESSTDSAPASPGGGGEGGAGGASGGEAPAPPAPTGEGASRDSDQEYTVVQGDSLYRIADRLYGKPNLWRSIHERNRDQVGSNPGRIHPDNRLTIPSLASIISTGTNGNQVLWAFEAYWDVSSSRVDGARRWDPEVIRAIHVQMQALPDQDTRNGVWSGLQLTNSEALRDRAAWDGSNFIVGQNADTTSGVRMGHGTALSEDAATGATTIKVIEPARFAVDETVAIERRNPDNKDTGKITAIADTTYTLDNPLTHDHEENAEVTPDDDTATRDVNWLAATVRHEIGHAVETAIGGVTDFTQGQGGWWTGNDFDAWAGAMSDPWGAAAGVVFTEEEKGQVKQAIVDAVANGTSDLEASVADDHPLKREFYSGVGVIDAASICLAQGDNFFQIPDQLYASNGKRFTISNWYRTFMYHNENVVTHRVSEYSLYAPAEFFAETYTVFYEEAGQPGVTEDQYGRLIRNSAWREWMRTNIHNRGHSPSADGTDAGAAPSGASVGKHSGNPGR